MRTHALVTGGASGIGAATARLLRARDLRVTIADVNADSGREVASEIGAAFVALDVSDPNAWAGSLHDVDVLHLNAGVADNVANLRAVSEADYRTVMAVNADGVFFGLREAARAWAGRCGDVVVTSSAAVLEAPADNLAYTMTKFAVLGLVRAAAPGLARSGIRVNAVCPGLVDTAIVPGDMLATYRRAGVPVLDPETVAAAVVDLVFSDHSGTCWLIADDGGPRELEIAARPVDSPGDAGGSSVPPAPADPTEP